MTTASTMRAPGPRSLLLTLAILLCLVAGSETALAARAGYLRTPDIHGERVVFCAEGDIWSVSDQGGLASRLTTHAGNEYAPTFSPDGDRIAFTGDYDGNRDIFVMPVDGGEPHRLTWHPATDEMIGWTPDGKSVIFRSWRESPHFSWELYTVPAGGGDATKLPLGWAARIDMDPDSGLWAFSRISRDTRTWKRYRGGTASEIWIGDPKKENYRQVTEFTGTDAYPMWHDDRVYFISDQGGTYNIWSMTAKGEDRKRHTDEGDWDARWPGMGPDGRIAYMLAGGIKVFDPRKNRSRGLRIELPSERVKTRQRYPDAGRYLTDWSLAPDGDRVAVACRGEIFSVPVEEGVTLPVTHGSGAREERVSYGPKGERLLYISDREHEEAFHIADAWGRGDDEVIKPAGNRGYHYRPSWSPDGEWIAYGDGEQRLSAMPASGGKAHKVDQSDRAPITNHVWSPDGRWLAYTKLMDNDFGSIFIYDTQEKESRQVTSDYTDDGNPAWDPDGQYLYFTSNRNMNPLFGSRDFNLVEVRNSKLYLMLLQADGENPFANTEGLPPGDEDEDEAEEADKEEGEDEESDDEDEDVLEPVLIDFDGLGERMVELAVEPGQYSNLGAVSGKLFYVSQPLSGWSEDRDGGENGPRSSLHSFDLEAEEADLFMGGVAGYDLAPGADKIAVGKGRGRILVLGTGGKPSGEEEALSLDGIVIDLDPAEEWKQIYHEAWRRMRDRYWDEGMAGLNWKKMRDQYAKLLPLIANRADLTDLLGELIGELNTGHTYVWGGDANGGARRVPTGLLGADFSRERSAFRVDRIYRGDEADDLVSPLLAPGVGLSVGDYILGVNGQPFGDDRPLLASLEQLADKDILLTVADDARGQKNRRDVVVHTLGFEQPLRYADWVRQNREWVDEQSDGKFGYIHIPDMGYNGMTAFNRWFYPQRSKEGLVVDCRWNGGGFVSQLILERLRRPVTAWGRTRMGRVNTYPAVQLNGPFVVLTNQFAGSDGDIFPRAVQLEKLAPVIGKRSWGGVIGINMSRRMVDGGLVTYPYAAWWDAGAGWGVENHGVDPDIVVENPPAEVATGKDAQLERGLVELVKRHRSHPPLRPEFEPVRSKARDAYRDEN
jgi:tricorn protease